MQLETLHQGNKSHDDVSVDLFDLDFSAPSQHSFLNGAEIMEESPLSEVTYPSNPCSCDFSVCGGCQSYPRASVCPCL